MRHRPRPGGGHGGHNGIRDICAVLGVKDFIRIRIGIRIDVLDRGTGMSPRVLEQAMLPFYSTKASGTGVGLPLCREIVEAHGGRVEAQSPGRGRGTTISIRLPVASAPVSSPSESPEAIDERSVRLEPHSAG